MRELVTHRYVVLRQAIDGVRHRYAGGGFGLAWLLLGPLTNVLLYGALASFLIPLNHRPSAVGLHLCSGLLPWLALTDGLSRGTQSLVRNAATLRAVPMPTAVVAAAAAVETLLTVGVAMLVVACMSLAAGTVRVGSIVVLTLVGLLMATLALGLTLILATLRVFFADVPEALRFVLVLAMWAVPIVYPVTLVPANLRAVMELHPFDPFLAALRWALAGGVLPGAQSWTLMLVWPLVLLSAGAWVATALEADVRDTL